MVPEESQDSQLKGLLAQRDRLRQDVHAWEVRDWWLPFARRSTRAGFAQACAVLRTVEQQIAAREQELRTVRWQQEQQERAERASQAKQRVLEHERQETLAREQNQSILERLTELAARARALTHEQDHSRERTRDRGWDRGGYER